MKIRNGFVSNSSSSSFIISDINFPTVRSLATHMLNQQLLDFGDADYIESLINKLSKIDENFSVCFPSCNYDTYIRKVGDCYLVSTCNNTDWDLYDSTTILTDTARNCIKNIMNTFKTNSYNYDRIEDFLDHTNYDFSHFGNDFYDLSKDIIGVETSDHCPNKNIPGHDYINGYIWDTVKFGKICLVCNPYYKRKDKLDIINRISTE